MIEIYLIILQSQMFNPFEKNGFTNTDVRFKYLRVLQPIFLKIPRLLIDEFFLKICWSLVDFSYFQPFVVTFRGCLVGDLSSVKNNYFLIPSAANLITLTLGEKTTQHMTFPNPKNNCLLSVAKLSHFYGNFCFTV